jgi:hypothetical protein
MASGGPWSAVVGRMMMDVGQAVAEETGLAATGEWSTSVVEGGPWTHVFTVGTILLPSKKKVYKILDPRTCTFSTNDNNPTVTQLSLLVIPSRLSENT